MPATPSLPLRPSRGGLRARGAGVRPLAWLPRTGRAARRPFGLRHEAPLADGGRIVFWRWGEGRTVVLLASMGRSVSDFNELARDLNAEGYAILALESRGIGGSSGGGRRAPQTLFHLAEDVRRALHYEGVRGPVTVIGHGFGGQVACAFAAIRPEQTRDLVLVAAGAPSELSPELAEALRLSMAERRPRAVQDRHLRRAFFAPDSPIAPHWRHGWHPGAARDQVAAARATPREAWAGGGDRPVLVLQGEQDAIAPPRDALPAMEAAFGERLRAVRIDGAGHALLPERPEAVSEAVRDWLSRGE